MSEWPTPSKVSGPSARELTEGAPGLSGVTRSTRLFRSTAIFASVSFGAYWFGFAKSILVTRYFGTTAAMDAYTIGVMIPNLLGTLLASSSVDALIPVLALAEREGREERANLFHGALFILIGASIVIASLVAAFPHPILRLIVPRFEAERLGLAVRLLRLASPLLVLNVIYSFASAELLSRGRYAAVALGPALYHLGPICALLLFHRAGIPVLVWGAIAGAALQALVFAWPALSHNRLISPLRLRAAFVRKALFGQGKLIIVSTQDSANSFVDQAMAALLPVGNVSALSYAGALSNVVEQTVISAVGLVALPEFSALVAAGNIEALKERARRCLGGIVMVAAPVCMFILGAGQTGIRLVFQHGVFTSQSTRLVFVVWAGYTLGLVPHAIGMIAVRLITAFTANNVLVKTALILLPLNALFDYILMQRMGAFGISLCTSLLYLVSGYILISALRQKVGLLLDGPTWSTILKAVSAAGFAAIPFVALRYALGNSLSAAVAGAILFPVLLLFSYDRLGLAEQLPADIQRFVFFWRRREPDHSDLAG